MCWESHVYSLLPAHLVQARRALIIKAALVSVRPLAEPV